MIDPIKDIQVVLMDNGHREVRACCHILNSEGLEIATGLACASTMETKYRYRGGEKKAALTADGKTQPLPKEYWNLKDAGKTKEAQELVGGPGFGPGKVDGAWLICELGAKMENPDIADTYNTILKIAKKRAFVDGMLTATGASDLFTQDAEDVEPATNAHQNGAQGAQGSAGAAKTPAGGQSKPQAKTTEPQAKAKTTEPQAKAQPQAQAKAAEPEAGPGPGGEAASVPNIITLANFLAKDVGFKAPNIIVPYLSHDQRNVTVAGKAKPVIDYTVGEDDNIVQISLWGTAIPGIKEGVTLAFRGVTIREGADKTRYFNAATVAIVEEN
jgi:hypothetical protein